VLTAQLAPRCDRLLALDVAAAALAQASARCPGVRFERRRIPQAWPPGRFDLILLSEVLYYLDGDAIRATAQRSANALQQSGCILLVHYLGETDYPMTGDDAAGIFTAAATSFGLKTGFALRTPGYRIDRLDPTPRL
jgi:trans-aconitate methyltransferase